MPYRDPKCVYVADDFGTAGLVVSWLAGLGIEAMIMDEATLGGLEGLTAWAPGRVSTRGLEVWVKDPDTAADARTQLDAKAAEIAAMKAARAARVGTVTAICEECGGRTEFPMSVAGRTENCPHCRAYIDVPDPDAADDGEYWNPPADDTEPA
ncbi:MAG: hypothetical protein ACRC7O_00500 [Fimbriiglobus sp.]